MICISVGMGCANCIASGVIVTGRIMATAIPDSIGRWAQLDHRSPEFHSRTGAAFWLQQIDAVADTSDRLDPAVR